MTGISVDAAGEPVAVIAMCEGAIDSLILYTDSDGEEDVSEWEASGPVDGLSQVNLRAPGAPWKPVTALPAALDARETYILYGATADNDWSSAHVEFTTTALAGLSSEEVLTQIYDQPSDTFQDRVTDVETFQEEACR